ncbi:MAG: RluA family pseudouridine synthase [Treponema sp.]|nr:RluA family pseudouridine synthase [Treponema sp.]
MFPPFPQDIARHFCQDFISDIESGFLQINHLSQESEERKNHGIMVGCLVCWDKEREKRIILHAVSGISVLVSWENNFSYYKNNLLHIIVPPIVDVNKINAALAKNDFQIHKITEEIKALKLTENKDELEKLSLERTKLTDESLSQVFDLYSFYNFNHEKISLREIISFHNGKLPPTGTGDCCAPKLLSYCFEHNLQPLSMDEMFFGKSSAKKINGKSYSPCNERCGFILPWILGLEILYQDKQIVVINKPSGLLSVPGRGEDKQDCAVSRVKKLFPNCIEQPSVHRLDMETSGILILALTEEVHRDLCSQFEQKLVQKKYIALLDGNINKSAGELAPKKGEQSGRIELSFRVDLDNRPFQIYDEVNGKKGITLWEKLNTEVYVNPDTGVKKSATRVLFTPLTGRTHQLRLASSYQKGLGLPIIGDSLYGKCSKNERLLLHAYEISFFHPISKKMMHIICEPDF